TIAALSLAAKPATPPRPAPAAVQPAYTGSGSVQPRYATSADDPDSQILDKWKDSGKPLK
ncbi:hypothetical protein ABTI49_20185, partial [Acinetobacter baumannii]